MKYIMAKIINKTEESKWKEIFKVLKSILINHKL